MKRILLITGSPGSGKTTLIYAVAEALARYHPSGFLTLEIREGGIRRGFLLKNLGEGETSLPIHRWRAGTG